MAGHALIGYRMYSLHPRYGLILCHNSLCLGSARTGLSRETEWDSLCLPSLHAEEAQTGIRSGHLIVGRNVTVVVISGAHSLLGFVQLCLICAVR